MKISVVADTTAEERPVFSLTGARQGSHLLVVGQDSLVAEVSDQLSNLPSLVYLRGSLTIATSRNHCDADDVLDLSSIDASNSSKARRAAYWTILARAASLGMISGRGIPRRLIPSMRDAA